MVGEVKSFDLSLRQDSLDISVMGNDFKRVRGGMKHGTGRATMQFDYSDAQQKQLFDNILVGDGIPIAEVGFFTDDGKFIQGSILVTEFSPKSAYNAIFSVDASFEFHDEYTITWA